MKFQITIQVEFDLLGVYFFDPHDNLEMSLRLIYEGLEYIFLPCHCTPQLPSQVEHFVHYFLKTYLKKLSQN